ncbi:hypothetical protein FRB99_003681 [Tulasnella sp. 403]|nr:hypothetical protein FRB99_003681 [Tulasnella sp. 403]
MTTTITTMGVDTPSTPPPNIINAWEKAFELKSQENSGVSELDLAGNTGLSTRNILKLIVLSPGTRLQSHSTVDTLVTCISGAGLVWQNGYTYPFTLYDAGGWKASTGAAWTIINDAGPGSEDLVLLLAQECNSQNKIYFPLKEDIDPSLTEDQLWTDVPTQNELGPHPGVPGIAADGTTVDVPAFKQGTRPSNISNGPTMTDGAGTGELFCEATSLSEDTGLSGRIGINFEIGPPGTRSSDAHAHSLEDELIFVLGGDGLVWINGHVYPVSTGDAVGFAGGTGDAHVFINDSNAEEPLGGQDLALWIFGENRRRSGDRLYYPLNPEKKDDDRIAERWWDGECMFMIAGAWLSRYRRKDCPGHELGPHPGRPARPAGL